MFLNSLRAYKIPTYLQRPVIHRVCTSGNVCEHNNQPQQSAELVPVYLQNLQYCKIVNTFAVSLTAMMVLFPVLEKAFCVYTGV